MDKMTKLMSRDILARKYLDHNPVELFNYLQTKHSLQVLEAKENEKELKSLRLSKKEDCTCLGGQVLGRPLFLLTVFCQHPFTRNQL
jgi:hypothetical protein